MSSYPPDYDERLLDKAPKATKAEKQEGYNVNLLASDNSDAPMNAIPPGTVDGHPTLEAGAPPTKESYSSSYSVPWYRQKKWRIFMLIGAILVIGAIVGGAVGGTIASKDTKSNSPSNGSGPSTASIVTATGTTSTPTQSSRPLTSPGDDPPLPETSSATGSGIGPIVGTTTSAGPGSFTTGTDNNGGNVTPSQVAAPVVAWSD